MNGRGRLPPRSPAIGKLASGETYGKIVEKAYTIVKNLGAMQAMARLKHKSGENV